ncbi:sterol desaturase family protein [Coleofasciculus sp. FACHB-1120]|uniref:sterol desaturase family protein n=1 Tax=Coleofasciculus sp. FACHB-1120 TaxID=2692783 RepID=UPI001682F9B8|nr:sterol desaturase family protein [Coleofasciculus sp. FACHB-1120]MBD2740312.1 sterol desaturase family protein [Coleofasciculus sp. FACHB-1120]
MGVFFTFAILMTLTVANQRSFTALRTRTYEDWILDAVGLFFQGVLIPILQLTVVYQMYHYLLPSDRALLALPPVAAFLLSFVFVDYIYYWNHRLLHSRWLWSLHAVHHTSTEMNVLSTSRNTLWTSFLIVYLWVHALFIYLLQDPTWYITGVSLSSALDLWRHSTITPIPNSWLYRWLSALLIVPQDHAWHHASSSVCGNYGANFKLWDRMHGTYYKSDRVPDSLGVKINLTLTQKLLWPWKN